MTVQYATEVERTICRLSLAVSLADEFAAGGAPAGRVTVAIRELNMEAVRNRSGYYLFTGLPAGSYTVTAASDCYFPVETRIDTGKLDPASPVVNIALKPGAAYPFPPGTTLLRGQACGAAGIPLQGASMEATVLIPGPGARAKVNQGGAVRGDASIHLVEIVGGIGIGDLLLVRDPDRSRLEFCRIAAPLPPDPGTQPFNLAGKLRCNHPPGTVLYGLVADNGARSTMTDERGEFAVYFKLVKASRFMARLKLSHAQYATVEREVEVVEGDSSSLGVIHLSAR